jgi:hypothetical protein
MRTYNVCYTRLLGDGTRTGKMGPFVETEENLKSMFLDESRYQYIVMSAVLVEEKKTYPEGLNELGYTEDYLRDHWSEHKFDFFIRWMRGQTVGIVDGETTYYYTDVDRFSKGLNPVD